MIYSKTSGTAIRALAFMASQPPEKILDIKGIAKACHESPSYLAKIFQVLTRAGFVASQRGAGGGYAFRRSPQEISILSVIQTTDDSMRSPLSNCVMGLNQCNDKSPCLIHNEWAQMTRQIRTKLGKSTIKDLAVLIRHWKAPQSRRNVLSKKVKAVFFSKTTDHE